MKAVDQTITPLAEGPAIGGIYPISIGGPQQTINQGDVYITTTPPQEMWNFSTNSVQDLS
ncbi:MAG: hypothetical protein IIB44_11395 [Candidatus Marinimicrobia bacterium]|nr:hypothetical protein [Candidatus Neomarinimicrobiota bacterium]